MKKKDCQKDLKVTLGRSGPPGIQKLDLCSTNKSLLIFNFPANL